MTASEIITAAAEAAATAKEKCADLSADLAFNTAISLIMNDIHKEEQKSMSARAALSLVPPPSR